jgi:hypothetical protein
MIECKTADRCSATLAEHEEIVLRPGAGLE